MSEVDVIQLAVPAQLKYLNVAAACMREMLMRIGMLPESTITNMQLALQELCTNIVRHAYVSSTDECILMTLTFDAQTREFIIETSDTGPMVLDPKPICSPHPEDLREGGYGLYLIHKIMDDLSYTSRSGQAWHSTAQGEWEAIEDMPLPVCNDKGHASKHNHWRLVRHLGSYENE